MNTQKMRLIALVLAAELSGTAQAAMSYSVTALGNLGGYGSLAYGINANGQAVGSTYVGGNEAAYLYSGGSMTALGTLGGLSSAARGINASGQIIGGAQTADGAYHAFLYSNGSMADLGTLGGSSSFASGINDSGQVVGGFVAADGFQHAFLYSNGSMADLGTLSGGFESYAYGINASGQVVGASDAANGNTHAFIYSNGSMTNLDISQGGANSDRYSSFGFDINVHGQVVGYVHDNVTNNDHAFWRDNNGDLATLGLGYASAINSSFEVVGVNVSTGVARGFYYSYATGTVTSLSDLIDPLSGSNWIIEEASDINDSGQIVARGFQNVGGGYSGALLLTPTVAVPEPQIYAMLLTGLGLVRFAVRRTASI